MNFSVRGATRKWAFGRKSGLIATGLILATALLTILPNDEALARRSGAPQNLWDNLFRIPRAKSHRASAPVTVPLPQPRPPEAPKLADQHPGAPAKPEIVVTPPPNKDDEQATLQPPAPSACRLALIDDIAIAPSIPDIHGEGGCGGEDLVRLETVILPDHKHVPVKPAAIMRCKLAAELANWVRTDIAPLGTKMNTSVSELDNLDSFECRGRNRVAGAKLSEHGRANALDVRAFKFANGQSIVLPDITVSREVREAILHSMCARFTTVLGPGSDGYHEDHIHLDLIERRNNYKICQWVINDSLPAVAPSMPEPRPDGAPVPDAAKSDKPQVTSSDGVASKGLTEPSDKNKEAAPSKPAKPDRSRAIKKRRQSGAF